MDGVWKVCPEAGGPLEFPGFNGNDAVLSIVFLLNLSMCITMVKA